MSNIRHFFELTTVLQTFAVLSFEQDMAIEIWGGCTVGRSMYNTAEWMFYVEFGVW